MKNVMLVQALAPLAGVRHAMQTLRQPSMAGRGTLNWKRL